MDAFFCITLSIIILRSWWRHNVGVQPRRRDNEFTVEPKSIKSFDVSQKATPEELELEKLNKEVEKQKQRDIADLKKQGYDDELIAVILPTLNNGQ